MTLAVLEVARERGLRVPEDLSVISFDDTPVIRFSHPPLTAVRQPIAEVAARAVELIIADQAGKKMSRDPVIVPAGLVIRNSTAPCCTMSPRDN